tara:strand:+ start:18230 stop:18826 length:597 start_codon:yes stop_codon:yes gene_type:complete
MIVFINNNNSEPFKKLRKLYQKANTANQQNIEAISISSFSKLSDKVNARYVNLKYVDNDKFIFFTNYESPKSMEFNSHPQITALIYWSSINAQIRINASIKKTSSNFNKKYFQKRDKSKNALAISSKQSSLISSYEEVLKNYKRSMEFDDLNKCPEYWGGYAFKPNYFEFWQGHDSRLNKRQFFKLKESKWIKGCLQP